MQAAAVVLVVVYYRFEGLRAAADSLAHLKERGGIGFDFVSGAIAGGFLPQFAKVLTGRARFSRDFWSETLFAALVYAVVGVEVELFYRGQTLMFGSGLDPMTLMKKTIVDMFVVSPVLFIPTAVVMFDWRETRAVRHWFTWAFYRDKVLIALIPAWAFWIPALFCVYAMPPNLQFPLSQLLEAAWSVLFVFIATQGSRESEA